MAGDDAIDLTVTALDAHDDEIAVRTLSVADAKPEAVVKTTHTVRRERRS